MDKENVLVIETGHRLGKNGEAFRHTLVQQAGITKFSFTVNKFPGVYSPGGIRSARSAGDHFVGVLETGVEPKWDKRLSERECEL